MPKRSKAARLIQQLQDWSDEELGDLAEMIQGLLESRREQVEEENQETREGGTTFREARGTRAY